MSSSAGSIAPSFIFARIHSLMGLGIVIFLIEHLLTNSQAALFIGADGAGFIRMVNFLHNLPYLQVVEVCLIGIPIAFHAIVGIKIAIKGKSNNFYSKGTRPLMNFAKNHAYTWQRVTSWILLFGIILHVAYMRFFLYPIETRENKETYFLTRLTMDRGLYTVADRLHVRLIDEDAIQTEKNNLSTMSLKMSFVDEKLSEVQAEQKEEVFNAEHASIYDSLQRFKEKKGWVAALEKRPLKKNEVIAASTDFGAVTLLNVREAFKSPFKCALYTIFVLAAVFHGFNGLWTFLITWGIILRAKSQKVFTKICMALVLLFAFLGLAAVWGTYWINLKS